MSKEAFFPPYKRPAPEPEAQKKPKKQLFFCKDCIFAHKGTKNTNLWECQSPSEFVRNFQSGQTHYTKIYCVTKNLDGECIDFVEKVPVALQKVKLPQKEELLILQPSFFKRIFGRPEKYSS